MIKRRGEDCQPEDVRVTGMGKQRLQKLGPSRRMIRLSSARR